MNYQKSKQRKQPKKRKMKVFVKVLSHKSEEDLHNKKCHFSVFGARKTLKMLRNLNFFKS